MPAHVRAFDAVVLAGGRSTRLGGADKPGLVVGQRTLLGSVIWAVTAAGASRVVVVGPERPVASGGGGQVSYTREDPPGGGPVAALRCGLAEVSAPDVVLVAADLPFLRPPHVTRLLAGLARTGVVLLDASGRPQWLASCWPAALLRAALGAYEGSSLRGVLGPLEPAALPDETAAGEPPPWLDCDTAEDLRVARDWAARPGTEQEATR